jgi:hypothetical protein
MRKPAIETELESDFLPSAGPEFFLFSMRVHSLEQGFSTRHPIH